ncbi:MAG TPA: translocation/assembly module TamB domain-containing protein [Bryobacteraceae bacterium]
MTRRKKKILLALAGSVAALILVLAFSAILILQSAWFAQFARGKIISLLQESSGAAAEIGSLEVDPWHLTVRIRNFVLHGTEPRSAGPLAQVQLLEVRLKLFSGWKHLAGLSYLGIERPQVDLIVFPNGATNIPRPKKPSKPSGRNSTLETVVSLSVDRFRLQNGLLQLAEEKAAFNARGENLRVLLNYDFSNPKYEGGLSMDPLLLAFAGRPPLRANVNIPLLIEANAIRVTGARVTTPQSRMSLTAALETVNAPVISAHLNADISLPEIQRSVNLPIHANSAGAPKTLSMELAARIDARSKAAEIQTAHLALGRTGFQASGNLVPGNDAAVRFNADLALGELSRLMGLSELELRGNLLANGAVKLDANGAYSVNGTLDSRDMALSSGTVQVPDIKFYSPFHADPYLVSLDGMKLNALGGDLGAKIFVANMRQASLEGRLRNFSLPVLAAVLTGRHLGYAGTLDGVIQARGDLKAKGATGYRAEARLGIAPGTQGVPLSGRLDLSYSGAKGTLDLAESYLTLPDSRIDLSGSLEKRIDINLISHNLSDFLPALAFASSKPVTSLPVTLQGGAATVQTAITGRLAAPQIAGHIGMTRFMVEKRPFDELAADVIASPGGASIQNGMISGKALQSHFAASIGLRNWKPVTDSSIKADLTARNGDVADLLSLAGQSSIPAGGQLAADVHINGTYGNPLGSATLQVQNGIAYGQPFARLYSGFQLSDQLVTISSLELDTAGGRVNASGSLRHPRETFSAGHAQLQIAAAGIQLADLKPLQERSPGTEGTIRLTANAAADLSQAKSGTQFSLNNVSADLSANGLRMQKHRAGDITAAIRTSNGGVNYNLVSDFAGSNIHVNGRTELATNYPTTADASIRNLSIRKTLELAGQPGVSVSGDFSADAHVSGTLQAPAAKLEFALSRANVYQEPVDRLQGTVEYSNALIRIPSVKLDAPAGSIALSGSFAHPANDFSDGTLNLKVDSTDLQLARITHVERAKPGLAGTLRLGTAVAASLRKYNGASQVLISTLNADASANELRVGDHPLGQAKFLATTEGKSVNFRFDSDFAQSQIHGTGVSQLTGAYPTRASLSFANIRYTSLAPFLFTKTDIEPPGFDALAAGQLSVDGPLLNAEELNGRLELNQLDLRTNPQMTPTGAPPVRVVDLRNQGPIIVSLSRSVVRVDQLRISGPDTSLAASGAINLKNNRSPLGLTVAGDADLRLLQDVNRKFYSSGALSLNATLRGSFAHPLVNGQIVLKNANVNYTEAPNGLSNANGIILLNGTSASVQTLTAESGGGKISVAGFVGFSPAVNFNLRANANKVRVRYSGVSVTSDANISLLGSARRSLLRGAATIQRIAYNSSSDVGSLLSTASTPPSTPTAPNSLVAGMRLDIHILTAPDLRVVSTYADKLEIFADMTVRGTAANPGMLGRLHVTNGQLVFFGNTYTVSTGTVNFYDPNSIAPVLDVSLQTIAQGVDVTIGVSGTMDDLRLSYRSDPPLSFPQIVQLLATNTTPANPVVAAHQPTAAQQSLGQMGESALLGQAIANPLASRMQRVFGLSQFKIDPSVAGNNGQPTARVTLQQKVASNITFTYITDVTETNSEIVRVEWDLTPKLSAVALRDFNGNISLEFFYKFKKR